MTRRHNGSTLSTDEFAAALGIAPATARAHAGELGAIRIGRVLKWPKAALDRLLSNPPASAGRQDPASAPEREAA